MDYDALRTLESVIRNQNFERAAKELLVTQSAVSQRINQLEVQFGQRLLVRELPYRATEIGEKILAHYRKVLSLEQELDISEINPSHARPTFRIAMNVDTLETWFQGVLYKPEIAKSMNLEVTVDDEKYTLNYLKSGTVDLSIGIVKTPVSNHSCVKLGSMTYRLIASPEFQKNHLPKRMADTEFEKIPAIVFNERDDIHTEYLKKHYGYSGSFPKTSIPSVSGIKTAIISGFGYGIHCEVDIQKELKSGKLVELDKKSYFQRELYLHYWNYQTPALKKLVGEINTAAKTIV